MSTIAPPRTSIASFRCWIVERGQLRAATEEKIAWPTRDHEAQCDGLGFHAAPALRCRCGIHACDSPATVGRFIAQHRDWFRRHQVVHGAVLLWGDAKRKVIVGELEGEPGYQYRAPYARIVAFADSPAARKIGKRMGVPVVRADYLEAFAEEHGTRLRPPGAKSAPAATDRRPRLPLPRLPSLPRPAISVEAINRALGWALGRALNGLAPGLLAAVRLLALAAFILLRTFVRAEVYLLFRSWQGGLGNGLCCAWLGIALPAIVLMPLLSHLETAVRHLR